MYTVVQPSLLGGVTGFSNFPYKVFEGFSNLTSSLPDTIIEIWCSFNSWKSLFRDLIFAT
jgi:hypothetical protein